MKELSIEEKAKAYDEIIKKANKMHHENCEACKVCLEGLIPEFRESEDEKIEKELLNHLKKASYGKTLVVNTLDYKRWADWLEKQGGQNKQEKDIILCHLWHDESEKCLDKTAYILFHSTYDNTWNVFTAGTVNWNVVDKWAYLSDIINIVNKDSKQSEQKPVDKVEPKFKVGDKIIGIISGMQYYITEVRGDCYYTESGCIIMFCAQNNFELVDQKPAWSEEDERIIDGLISICDEAQDNIPRLSVRFSHVEALKNWITSLKDRVQPKQEWKQENTHDLTDFENVMMHIGDSFFGENAGLDPNDTIAIKEQATILLGLVPKQEWSEEDEMFVHGLIRGLAAKRDIHGHTTFSSDCIDITKTINWLKSLRPQNRWKPSDEQMEALIKAVDIIGTNHVVLTGLIADLQKLTE